MVKSTARVDIDTDRGTPFQILRPVELEPHMSEVQWKSFAENVDEVTHKCRKRFRSVARGSIFLFFIFQVIIAILEQSFILVFIIYAGFTGVAFKLTRKKMMKAYEKVATERSEMVRNVTIRFEEGVAQSFLKMIDIESNGNQTKNVIFNYNLYFGFEYEDSGKDSEGTAVVSDPETSAIADSIEPTIYTEPNVSDIESSIVACSIAPTVSPKQMAPDATFSTIDSNTRRKSPKEGLNIEEGALFQDVGLNAEEGTLFQDVDDYFAEFDKSVK